MKSKIDTKELELPDTTFVRDIENRVFQTIVLECLSKIEGVSLLEENFIGNLFHRNQSDRIKGISIDQNDNSISIKIELNISYGLSIPEKASEIQSKISEEISKLTGLHVSCIHVVFKNIIKMQNVEESCESSKSEE